MQATISQRQSGLSPILFLILIVLAASIGLSISHAINANHPEQSAEDARKCIKDNGSMIILQVGDKFTKYCLNKDGTVGIQVVKRVGDKLEEVTAYMKSVNGDPLVYKVYTYSDFWKFAGSRITSNTVVYIKPERLKTLYDIAECFDVYVLISKSLGAGY